MAMVNKRIEKIIKIAFILNSYCKSCKKYKKCRGININKILAKMGI